MKEGARTDADGRGSGRESRAGRPLHEKTLAEKEDIFRFRRFTLRHGGAALKLGTDAVMLGAWCTASRAMRHILDAGTGCGIIALMLAQRTGERPRNALAPEGRSAAPLPGDAAGAGGPVTDGVDIDPASAALAAENFAASPWADRLRAWCGPIRQFAPPEGSGEGMYDLVVSNPPWFEGKPCSPESRRAVARHSLEMDYCNLAVTAARFLAAAGKLAAIVPSSERGRMLQAAWAHGFALEREAEVSTRYGKEPCRALVEFVRGDCGPARRERFCLTDADGRRSERWRELTEGFYLPSPAGPKKGAESPENEK